VTVSLSSDSGSIIQNLFITAATVSTPSTTITTITTTIATTSTTTCTTIATTITTTAVLPYNIFILSQISMNVRPKMADVSTRAITHAAHFTVNVYKDTKWHRIIKHVKVNINLWC